MTDNRTLHNGTSADSASGHCDATSDDLLLEQFFQPARSEQLADNGFSHRVVAAVAADSRAGLSLVWLSRLWTAACIVVAVGVFTYLDGWQKAVAGIAGMLSTMPTTTQLLHLMVCGAVLTTLAATEVFYNGFQRNTRMERITFNFKN